MEDRQLNQQAQALHREARYLGQSGNYDGALEKLAEAMRLEPDWPYPVYDKAFTYLLRGDTALALAYYNKTDELAPRGFFTTKTAIYVLQGEFMGEGIYMAYMQIEWTDDTDMNIAIAQSIAEKVPEFAPAWNWDNLDFMIRYYSFCYNLELRTTLSTPTANKTNLKPIEGGDMRACSRAD